ncbi:Vacuole membrane protein 1 [Gryllus bimaculatus]|nr:Vacuole membrane protein 1 [Gryllus bimaculatus]
MGAKKKGAGDKRKASHSNDNQKSSGSSANAQNQHAVTLSDNVEQDFLQFTKDQLKTELKKRGLKTSGNKTELLQRLGNTMAATTVKRKPDSGHFNGDTKSNKLSQQSIISREQEKQERERLVLWRQPILTVKYFAKELLHNSYIYGSKLLLYKKVVGIAVLVLSFIVVLLNVAGPHQQYIAALRSKAVWCLYWIGLGVLSSVGLGTGLHTFLLYLGPHIAAVTLAAYECGKENDPQWGASILNIMSKVRLEAMMWGAGTALGELPPYFMARAARLSGYDPDDEDDLREFEELQRKKNNPQQMTSLDAAKLFIERMVEKVGFFGILACASIPNPLFDLAGITCGHFLVPFWTFFGATLIGKAVIKMHIQKMFVIIAFNETLVENAVAFMALIPYVGSRLQQPFKEFLEKQKLKLHRRSDVELPAESNLLAAIFEKFVVAMILYFVVSIVNSLAQSHHKRLHKKVKGASKRATD